MLPGCTALHPVCISLVQSTFAVFTSALSGSHAENHARMRDGVSFDVLSSTVALTGLFRSREYVGTLVNMVLDFATEAIEQHASDSLDAPAETKTLHHQLLDLRILQQLGDPRVLHKTEEAVFDSSLHFGRHLRTG